jgi:hypothetical protein
VRYGVYGEQLRVMGVWASWRFVNVWVSWRFMGVVDVMIHRYKKMASKMAAAKMTTAHAPALKFGTLT